MTPSAAAVQDPRTYPQRMHDALLDACQRLLRSATLPEHGGVPSVLVITMTHQQFTTGAGTATTGHGQPITVADALNLTDQADIIPVVLNPTGGIIAYGRMRRHATPTRDGRSPPATAAAASPAATPHPPGPKPTTSDAGTTAG